MSKNYNPPKTTDKYIARLNKLASKCGPLLAFTDEENIQINQQLSEGLDDFLSKDRIRRFESELELKNIFLD
jgi:hypothetical protein